MSSQPTSFCVTCSVTSGVFAAHKALAKLLNGLAPLQPDSEDTDSIKIALREVMNNIVEHGYTGPNGVRCTLVENGLDIALTDTGEPLIDNAPSTNVQFGICPRAGLDGF
jgi:anti-sigma regulatory factor (Ser/Thr protein kinase)